MEQKIIVRVAHSGDASFANTITDEMASSAQARGTGIAKRSPEYVAKKINEGKSVIAITEDGTWVGFCYIEAWQHGQFVANSGLIVAPAFRKTGIAKKIKQTIFQLSRETYPTAKIFGLTTGLAVMKINSELGYEPVTYSELTDDEEFWAAMLYEPKQPHTVEEVAAEFSNNSKLYERFMKIKQSKLLNWFRKK